MFDYPLKKRELFSFMQESCDGAAFEEALNFLLGESVIYRLYEFYSLNNNFLLAERRFKGNAKAEIMLKKARVNAKLISCFPYVRGVAVSGSLSKNFADESADIDFFIITAKNRLWIARSFLHLFKKFTFLVNRQHMFCMNYFIDEEQPGIVEKNIYTAIEVATLMPLYGIDAFNQFYLANSWTKDWLPNHYLRVSNTQPVKSNWIKSITERMFNNAVGNLFDRFLMKITAKSWQAKTRKQKKNMKGLLLDLDVSKHYAKPNPVHFQGRLLKRYENKLTDIFETYEDMFQATAGI